MGWIRCSELNSQAYLNKLFYENKSSIFYFYVLSADFFLSCFPFCTWIVPWSRQDRQSSARSCVSTEWMNSYLLSTFTHTHSHNTYNQAVEAAFVCISYTYVSFQSIPRNHSSCRMCVCYVHRHVWRCLVIKYVFTQVRPYTDIWICWNSAPSFTNVKDIVQSCTPL